MEFELIQMKARDFLLVILFLQIVAYAVVFFDIPVARQIFGFMYFTFLPGFVIVKLLKLDELDALETMLLSLGLGVAFLMIVGLLTNEFSSLIGLSRPLSQVPLMTTINSILLLSGVLIYLRGETVRLFCVKSFSLSSLTVFFLCLPILSVVGAISTNAYRENWILLLLITAIVLMFVIGVTFKKLLPSKFYPLAIYMIAISLLFHTSLASPHIVSFGSDAPFEYFVFKITESKALWSSSVPTSWGETYGRINGMLSITVLPTTYSSLLKIDPTWIFKVLNPLIFAFVPLGLYQIWKKYIGKRYAFISTFLFMAQATFFTEMFGLNRQIIGELFLVLLILVITDEKIKKANKIALFVIFSFALVTSHYALAEIFLSFIILALILLVVLKHRSRRITVTMVTLFFAVMFTWYIYTSGSVVFDSLVLYGDSVYRQLSDFFDPASRGQTVLRGLGLESPPTVWNAISRIFAYCTQGLIVVGFIGLVIRRVKPNLDREYFALTSIAMGFLAILILVPGLASTMNMTRFYHILLFFIAPLCVLGSETLARFVIRKKVEMVTLLLLLAILTPYFLFQTNFVYEVTGSDSWSLPLSMYRMKGYKLYRGMGYIPVENIFGADWLSHYTDFQRAKIYADIDSRHKVLVAYGLILSTDVRVLSNTTKIEADGTVFLGQLNVVTGIVDGGSFLWNTTELSFLFNNMAKTYSNGGCEIYKNQEPTPNG